MYALSKNLALLDLDSRCDVELDQTTLLAYFCQLPRGSPAQAPNSAVSEVPKNPSMSACATQETIWVREEGRGRREAVEGGGDKISMRTMRQ